MAQRRLNKKLVTVLTVGLLLLFAVTGVWMIAKLPQSDPTPYVQQAIKAYEAGDLAKALQAYKQAWHVSQDPKWLLEAGYVAKTHGDAREALGAWENAILADPAFTQATRALVELRLEVAKLTPSVAACTELFRRARALLATESDKQNPLASYACGWALMYLRDNVLTDLELDEKKIAQAQQAALESGERLTPAWALAEIYLRQAVELDPDDPEVSSALADFYGLQAQWAASHGADSQAVDKLHGQADQVYKNLLERRPESVDAHLQYALFLSRRERTDEALAMAQKAAALAPNNPDVQLALAQVHIARQENDQAEQALNRAKQLAPDRLDTYRQLGLYYGRIRSDADKSLAVYREALDRPIDRLSYRAFTDRFARFQILIQAGQTLLAQTADHPDQRDALLVGAQRYCDEAVHEFSENAMTQELQGMIHRERGHLPEAIVSLEKADQGYTDALKTGAGAGMIEPYVRTRMLLADLYTKTDKPGLAERVLQPVVRVVPTYEPAKLQLASIENLLGKSDEALKLADEVLRTNPENRQAVLVKVEAYRKLGQTNLIASLREKLQGDTPLEQTRLAQVLLIENQNDQAEQQLLNVLKQDPAYLPALWTLLVHYVNHNRLDDARKLQQQAQSKRPDDRGIAQLGVLLATAENPALATQQTEKFLAEIPDPLSRALAMATQCMTLKDFPKAVTHLDEAEKLSPDNHTVIDAQCRLALTMKDWQRAERYVARAKQLNIDGADGGFFQGSLLLSQAADAQQKQNRQEAEKCLSSAVDTLENALRKFPSEPTGYIYLGAAYTDLGRFAEAVNAFQQALELNPNNGLAHKNLAQVLLRAGRTDEANVHIRDALRLIPNDPWVRQQSQRLVEEQKPQQGITLREQQRQQDPTNVENLIRLGQLYEKLNQLETAEQRYRQALDSAPQNLAVAWEVAGFYRRANRLDPAEALLKDLVRNVQEDQKPAAQLLVARHFRETNRPEEAERAYKVAVALNPNALVCREMADFLIASGRNPEALQWLDRALQAARQENRPVQQRDIHRWRTDLLLTMYDREQAETSTDQYLRDYPDDPWGYILLGRLRTLQNRVPEAIGAFTRAIELDPNNALAQFQLGRLHKALGNLAQAIEHLRTAKTLAPTKFDYAHRILLADAYQASGQGDLAISELREILADDPNAAGAVRYLVGALLSQKRYADAESLLREQMARQPNEPYWPHALGQLGERQGDPTKAFTAYQQAAKISSFAPGPVDAMLRLLEGAGKYDKVIQVIQDVLPPDKQNPLTRMRLANALHHNGKADQALQHYEQALSQAATSPVMLDSIVNAMGKTVGMDRTIAIVEQKLQADPDNPDIKFVLASCLERSGQRRRAIEILQPLAEQVTTPARQVDCLCLLGVALYEEGNLNESAENYKKALQLNPNSSLALNNLAYLLAEDLKRPEEALPYARRACQLAREDPNMLDTLGWIECLAGQYDAAIGTLQSALALSPDLVPVLYHLGEAYRRKADLPSAKQHLQKALQLCQGSSDQTYLADIQEALGKLAEPVAR